jgi:hypothetical protein
MFNPVRFIKQEIEHEFERRRAEQARLIRMRALLDYQRDLHRFGQVPSPEVQAEIDELFGVLVHTEEVND